MWDAGWYIAEVIMANQELFSQKRIVELGSGVGLTGIVLYHFCKPEAFYLTDYLDIVLNNCRKNLEISKFLPKKEVIIFFRFRTNQ